jgi:hypothetical protein
LHRSRDITIVRRRKLINAPRTAPISESPATQPDS